MVRSLDEKGAFLVKRAAERIARALGTSRVTAYAYLEEARATERRRSGRRADPRPAGQWDEEGSRTWIRTQVAGLDRRAFLRARRGAPAVHRRRGHAARGICPSAPTRASRPAATGKLEEVIGRRRLIVGTGTGNPPWHFDDAGKLSGFDIDMARIVAAGLFEDPNAVEFVQEASDARIANLLTDKVDVVFQFMTVNPARAQQIWFTIPYYREGIGLPACRQRQVRGLRRAPRGRRCGPVVHPPEPGRGGAHPLGPARGEVLPLDSQANVIQALARARPMPRRSTSRRSAG